MSMYKKNMCLISFILVMLFLLAGAVQAAMIQDLDATIIGSVTGDPVTEWADQSGNGNHAVNADGNVYYPSSSVSPSGLSGLDMGTTANSLQLFDTQSDGWLNQQSGNGFCVLVAFKCDGLTGDWNDVIGNTSAALTEGWGMRYSNTGLLKAYLNGNSLDSGGTVAAGDTIVFGCNYDPATGSYEFWDSKSNNTASITVTAADFTLATPVKLGRTTNVARYMNGMVGEVRVFDTVLNTTEFQFEQDSMIATWIEGYHLIPSPSNGATGVSINTDLAWSEGIYATSYDVYFGTDPTPDETEFKGNQVERTYELPQLDLGANYYWQIDEVDTGDPCSPWIGDVWTFETQLGTATMRKGPYLIYPGNNTEMLVLWQLDGNEVCSIEWGLDTSYSDGSAGVSEYGEHQYKHTITGLTPGAKYYYKCNIGTQAATGSFTAAPSDSATDVKFLMGGDRQGLSNTDRYQAAANAVNTIMGSDPAYQAIMLFAGDLVGNGDDETMQDDQWFNRTLPEPLEMMAKLPIQACQGNHESSGAGFQKYWPYPYVGDRYWSFDYGPVHVAVLNLDEGQEPYNPGSAQHNWLTNDLATTSKSFKIILAHHPAWGAGSHANVADIQNYIHPLCTQYGVQMYVNGHNHNYARAIVDGVHYVTSGGFGASSYSVDPSDPYVVVAIETMNLQTVEVVGNTMTVTSVDMSQTVLDTFQIIATVCGDDTCEGDEDQCNCPADCGSPPSSETSCTDGEDNDCDLDIDCDDADCSTDPACMCGDGTCSLGEDCTTCPEDCISRTSPPKLAYCCGDGTCEGAENETNCAVDCGGGSYCDDGTCDPGEDQCNCPEDCGTPPSTETSCTDEVDNDCDTDVDCDDADCLGDPACPTCGDETCDTGEDQCNCPADCGTPPSTETGYCDDGINNDCDADTDCDDTDCDGDPACPECGVKGDPCTSDADCCKTCNTGLGTCK